METSPRSFPTQHRNSPQLQPADCCKIVTFYEEFSDAIRAVLKFDSIMRAFSNGRPVTSTSWSFRLIEKPELNSLILQDASRADVIVVASHGAHELPEHIASWVTMFLAADQAERPVIVALHDENLEADGEAAPLCTMLETIANRTHATFMGNRDLEEASRMAPALSRMEAVRDEFPPSVRRWGIND